MADKPTTRGKATQKQEIAPDVAHTNHVTTTLYADVEAGLSTKYRDKLARMSPLAKELQLWIWSRPGPEWSYAELARQLSAQGFGRVPIGTVGAWFSRGTKPKGQGYQAILKLTGWPESHLLALLGRETRPTYVPDMWSLARKRAPERFHDANVLSLVTHWLDDLEREYNALQKEGGNGENGEQ